MTYNTSFVMQTSLEKSQLQALIDVRPSIVGSRGFPEVIQAIMNPRLKSAETMKKLANMHRILENVTTYYFENFLNIQERSILSEDLQLVVDKKFQLAQLKFVNFLHLLCVVGFAFCPQWFW